MLVIAMKVIYFLTFAFSPEHATVVALAFINFNFEFLRN